MAGITMIKACFVSLICEAFLHGVYTILCSAAFYLLLRKSRVRRTTPANILMIIVTAIMYLAATAHLILSFWTNFVAIFNQDGAENDGLDTDLNNFRDPKPYSQIALEMVNYIIGDSVVVWRTWVIWGKNPYIVIFPAACVLGGIVSGIGLVHSFATVPPGEAIYNTDMVNWFEPYGAFTCAINIYAVAAISYKTWQNVKQHRALGIKMTVGGGSCYGVLLILIESGIVYCFFLIGAVVLFSAQSSGVYIITDMLGQVTGIYPTVIIVLVCLKMSWDSTMTSTALLTTAQFVQPPMTSTASEGQGPTGLHSYDS
ncbi:hypothetical protein QCA50_019706 [Cerrena zonata]|uniref:Uncharacterized protein n=1 Tax=Cerrena zonata TaxID=2478898 RepID=A0AAW0FEA4_9APHY